MAVDDQHSKWQQRHNLMSMSCHIKCLAVSHQHSYHKSLYIILRAPLYQTKYGNAHDAAMTALLQ